MDRRRIEPDDVTAYDRSGADMAEWPADLRVRELPGVTP